MLNHALNQLIKYIDKKCLYTAYKHKLKFYKNSQCDWTNQKLLPTGLSTAHMEAVLKPGIFSERKGGILPLLKMVLPLELS